MAAQILWYTPIWAWLIFAVLTVLGLKRVRTETRTVRSIMLVPVIFVVWGLLGLCRAGFSQAYMPWLLTFFAGAPLALASNFHGKIKFDSANVILPGSVWPLLRMQLVFWAHYLVHVLAALDPKQSTHYLALGVYVSGASAGYFAGYALAFWRALQQSSPLEAAQRRSQI